MALKSAYLALALGLTGGGACAETFYYFNERFDVTAEIPVGYEAGHTATNGDGQEFLSPGGDIRVRVWGAHDILSSVAVEYDFALNSYRGRGDVIAYQWQDARGFEFSGLHRDGSGFYRRTLAGETCEGEPVMGSVQVDYASMDKVALGALIREIAESLHIGACG